MENTRRLSRRAFLKASAAVMVGLGGVAACAQPAPQPAAPAPSQAQPTAAAAAPAPTTAAVAAEAVKLSFVCDQINKGHTTVRDTWAKKFQEKFPNITVDHQTVPTADYNTKLQTLFAGGTPPDIYRYLQEVTPIVTVADKKMHLPLQDMVSSDKYDLADFRKDALNLYLWAGALYGLPRDYGNQNIFSNLDLFQKAGLTPPPADWTDKAFTFDAFLEMAKKLTVKNGDKTEQWGFLVNWAWRPWASWVYNNDATVVKRDDKGVATEIALTDPNAVEAMQFVQDLMHKHAVAPRPDMESELGGFDLFATGRVGMMINNPSSVNQYRTITSFKWDVATLPVGKSSKRGTGGGGSGWAAGASTKNPKAAWEFLKFISSAEAEQDEVAIGATTPARTSVATSPQFLDTTKPPAHAKGFADAEEYVVRDPVHARWPEISSRIVTPAMDQLFTNKTPAAEVAALIKSQADTLFKS